MAEEAERETAYRFRENQPVSWFRKDRRRSNQHCLYCGCFVGKGGTEADREHLVGRLFVPEGTLSDTAFNFIFLTCEQCNREKGNWERHVSSVTLFNSPARATNESVDLDARRKAEDDFHPGKKGVRVQDAHENISLAFVGPVATLRFGMVGPPQLVPEYVRLLAIRQVQGLFSLLTSPNPVTAEGTRILPAKNVQVFEFYAHSDWGNLQLTTITHRVKTWLRRAVIVSASGFFKAVMREDRPGSGEWFWALEWNKSVRVVGGIASGLPNVFTDLPQSEWTTVACQDGSRTRYRVERAQHEDALDLFAD